jgi:hypothetical protein
MTSASTALQQTALEIAEQQLPTFARIYLRMADAAKQFHEGLGRTYDDLGRARLREALNLRIARIFQDYDVTQEEYEGFILMISGDPMQREIFERILEGL